MLPIREPRARYLNVQRLYIVPAALGFGYFLGFGGGFLGGGGGGGGGRLGRAGLLLSIGPLLRGISKLLDSARFLPALLVETAAVQNVRLSGSRCRCRQPLRKLHMPGCEILP